MSNFKLQTGAKEKTKEANHLQFRLSSFHIDGGKEKMDRCKAHATVFLNCFSRLGGNEGTIINKNLIMSKSRKNHH